jgi:D-amino peptidase
MKLFISADFEGVRGIVDRSQCFPGSPDFERAKRLWVEEINCIVATALEAGATEVLVNEAHAGMNYMPADLLHPAASWISGYVKRDNQMEGLEDGCSGAILMGHAMAGTAAGVLNHTYVMRDVVEIRLNRQPIGELALNAYWAAYLGVPVILVVGDEASAQEIRRLDPQVETAVLKYGISQFSARNLPADKAGEILRSCTRRAVQRIGEIKPLALPDSWSMEIDFSLSEIAQLCSFVPGVERISGRTIRFSARDYRELQHIRIVCTNLALAVVRAHF